MAEIAGEQERGGEESQRRPSQIIEGTAVEVTPETEDPSPDQPEADAVSSGEDEARSGVEESRAAGDTPPRRGASLPELKGFVTHLAAGLLGGLVGVLALSLAWNELPVRQPAAAPDLSALSRQIDALEAAPRPNQTALGDLDQRLKSLESQQATPNRDLSGLTERVARLEDSLKGLADTAKNGGSVADAAALDSKLGELEQKLTSRIDATLGEREAANARSIAAINAAIGDLKAKLSAVNDANGGADLAGQLASLGDRLAKLEATLPNLSEAVQKESAEAQSTAAELAFANLKAAVLAGHPYGAELSSLRAAAPAINDLGSLPAFADRGLPTVAELTDAFQRIKDKSLAGTAGDDGHSLMDGLFASAKSLVKVRRVDANAPGDGADAVLARAEAKLAQGDLVGAADEVDHLSGPSEQAFAEWSKQARARAAAPDELARIQSRLPQTEQPKQPAP